MWCEKNLVFGVRQMWVIVLAQALTSHVLGSLFTLLGVLIHKVKIISPTSNVVVRIND